MQLVTKGGLISLIGGEGSLAIDGGDVTLDGGASGSGTVGGINLGTATTSRVGFFGTTPSVQIDATIAGPSPVGAGGGAVEGDREPVL